MQNISGHSHFFLQTNVMVDEEGNPRLSDFGLARVEPIQAAIAIAGSMSHSGGNPRWLAPELIFPGLFNGTGETTRESDVYAFGMTALEVCLHKAGSLKYHR